VFIGEAQSCYVEDFSGPPAEHGIDPK